MNYERESRHDYFLYYLTMFVNTSEEVTNDVIIAEALIELRDEIDSWSQDDIAAKYYVSQASVSRFIKKWGFSNFAQLRTALHRSAMNSVILNPPSNQPFSQVVKELHDEMTEVAESLLTIDERDVRAILRDIHDHKTIWFIGSELSMSVTRLLQVKLTGMGKNVFSIYSENMQKSVLETASDDSLVIAISLGQRWFKTTGIRRYLKKNAYASQLWTVCEDHDSSGMFSRVIMMGKTDNPDMGYNYLMQFVMMLYRLL